MLHIISHHFSPYIPMRLTHSPTVFSGEEIWGHIPVFTTAVSLMLINHHLWSSYMVKQPISSVPWGGLRPPSINNRLTEADLGLCKGLWRTILAILQPYTVYVYVYNSIQPAYTIRYWQPFPKIMLLERYILELLFLPPRLPLVSVHLSTLLKSAYRDLKHAWDM